jgi:hypothetical protein
MERAIDQNIYRLGGAKARGFAALSQPERFAMAQRGGRIAHQLGRAHVWTSEEAQAAGRIGGQISRRRKRVVK